MKPLLLPYIFNILVLIPVGVTTLLGGVAGGRRVFRTSSPRVPVFARFSAPAGLPS
jgi:hypothetical protein